MYLSSIFCGGAGKFCRANSHTTSGSCIFPYFHCEVLTKSCKCDSTMTQGSTVLLSVCARFRKSSHPFSPDFPIPGRPMKVPFQCVSRIRNHSPLHFLQSRILRGPPELKTRRGASRAPRKPNHIIITEKEQILRPHHWTFEVCISFFRIKPLPPCPCHR